MYKYSGVIIVLVLFVCSALSYNVCADSLTGEKKVGNKAGKNKKTEEKIKARKRILHMQEVEIFGNVEKPKAMFIIPRTPHQYYRNEYKRDFSEEILRPITREGIADRQEWQEAAPGP